MYVKAISDKVSVLNSEYQVIMDHSRLYGSGKESMKWLPYIELISRRPTALKYTTFYEELPDNWRKHFNGLASDDKRKALHALHTMLQKHDMGTASDALLAALSKGVQDADSILASYRLLTATSDQCQPLKLSAAVIKMPNFQTNNAKYHSLFGREASR